MRAHVRPVGKSLSGLYMLALLAVGFSIDAPAAAQELVKPVMIPELVSGKTAYDENCAGCHGGLGEGSDKGSEKGPPLVHRLYHPGHHGDAAFRRTVQQGSPAHHWKFGDMKPLPGVSEDEISAIIRYVRAIQKANGVF